MHVRQVIIWALIAHAAPIVAFFRLPCTSNLVVQRADPIVNPGQLASHVHTILGGNGFGFEMDYKSTHASTCSSCIVKEDMSNYWTPTLYYKAKNGSFISVRQSGGTIYYLQRSDKRDPEFSKGLLAFPQGFRMLAGDANSRNNSGSLEQRAISYACLGSNTPETPNFPNRKCPNGLRAQVFFPSCWDGQSFEHKDQHKHVAYPSGTDSGFCSPPFNKRFISLFFEVIWNTPDFDDMWYGNSQPFTWSNGDDTGYGLHGDFVNGWHVPTLQKAINECTGDSGVIEDCRALSFFTNEQSNNCKVPVSVHEQTQGVLSALPGCNKIQSGPAKAIPNKPCGAVTSIGQPLFPFTNVKDRGWRYIGCALDPAGRPRTLLGDSISDAEGMTVERCIDHCRTSGFSVAGLEFSRQCFCDNKISPNRLLDQKMMGFACDMPCAGAKSQTCGGASLISLYQQCDSGRCEDVVPPFINGSFTSVKTILAQPTVANPITLPTTKASAGRRVRQRSGLSSSSARYYSGNRHED